MDAWFWDLRHALRGLLRTPSFTVVSVLTLALGIGANTAIFSLLDEVFLRPLPVRAPEEIGQLRVDTPSHPNWDFAYAEYLDIARAAPRAQITGVGAISPLGCAFESGGQATRTWGAQVSGPYFTTLGISARLGRVLGPVDDRPDALPVVVLSHDLWRGRFASDPSIVGRRVSLDRQPFTVIGVTAPGFRGTTRGFPASYWIPLHAGQKVTGDSEALTSRNMRWLSVFVRVPPAGRPAATATLETAWKAAAAPTGSYDPGYLKKIHLGIIPSSRGNLSLLDGPGKISRMLMAVVLLLLTIACANVAGLILARTAGRQREIAVRLALGGTANRLARQFMCESLMVALAGGALGVLFATWATDLLRTFTPSSPFPLDLRYTLDGRVLAFTLVVTLGAAIAFGLVPALQASRIDLLSSLRRETGSGWWARRGLAGRRLLVMGQVALSVVLLSAAGLFLRSLWNERAIPIGFEPSDRVAVRLDLGATGMNRARALVFYRQLLERLEGTPGIRSASLSQYLPPNPGGSKWGFPDNELVLPGFGTAKAIDIDVNGVGPNYFATMGIPLVRGRDLTMNDALGEGAAPKAVINRTLAERLWPGHDPVGRTMLLFGPDLPPLEVVGLVEDGRYRSIRETPPPYLYLGRPVGRSRDLVLLAHVDWKAGNPFATLASVVHEIEPSVALFDARTMEQHVAEATVLMRFASTLLGLFGVLALGLSSLGLYGLVAFAVQRRTREIGLRLAFGATPGRVLRMIVGESFRVSLPGFIAGLALAIGLSRLVASLLYGVSPNDPWTYAAMIGLLALALLAAAWLPGRRAARLEPMAALREE